jgi:hypothetical protein
MSEISAASNEQSAGIEQVNQAITEMDDVTQQNAALVEEAAAATETMQGQANTLMEAVSVFKLDGVRGNARTAVAKSTDTQQASAAVMPHTRQRKLVKAKEGTDSNWKEF